MPEKVECSNCEEYVDYDDTDEDWVCSECREAIQADAELRSDHRHWCR